MKTVKWKTISPTAHCDDEQSTEQQLYQSDVSILFWILSWRWTLSWRLKSLVSWLLDTFWPIALPPVFPLIPKLARPRWPLLHLSTSRVLSCVWSRCVGPQWDHNAAPYWSHRTTIVLSLSSHYSSGLLVSLVPFRPWPEGHRICPVPLTPNHDAI